MKFGAVPLEKAAGAILAHLVRAGDRILKKGRVLTADDVAVLLSAGISEVVAATLEADDISEDAAASRIGAKLLGDRVRLAAPFTGRANLYAESDGLAVIDAGLIDAVNAVDESITVATVPVFTRVSRRQMLATVKIIPFAAPGAAVEKAERLASERGAVAVAPFRPRKAALVLTTLPGTKRALLDKTRTAIEARLRGVGSDLVFERQVEHTASALSPALKEAARESDLVLVFGASAITDRRDVIPAAIEAAGGTVIHFGMPVDPGNLLLLGKMGGADVVGLPGCARSPKLNGFDFVLWRLAAGLRIGREEIAAMGVGGLLTEIATRPQPRDEPALAPHAPKIAAIVLAAGASSRMGANKLLADVGGRPMVRHVVEAAASSSADLVFVVTGKDGAKVRAALDPKQVEFIDNPDFAKGLSESLKHGLRAVPEDSDGAVVLLGDMPGVTASLIDRLIAAFDPAEGRAICVATRNGKRGNPVLFARRFFSEIETIEGDVGARGLIGAYPNLVVEVEAEDDAPLIDIDTPEALAAYREARR